MIQSCHKFIQKECYIVLNVSNSLLNNSKVQTSILELDGRIYIAHLTIVGSFKCYLEDFETKKRSISNVFDNPGDAVEDAWNKIIHN